MNNKQKYQIFINKERVPVFSHPWWLDAVCGIENWEVILVEQGDEIIASFPYFMKKKYRFISGITMPFMTQKMGIYIKYPKEQTEDERLSYEKKIMNEIIDKLPHFDFFITTFDYLYRNWLPFYWKGFKQSTFYTYILPDISNIDSVLENFDRSKKKNIRKAEKEVEVFFDLSCKAFYENHVMTLSKQGQNISYSFSAFQDIYTAAYSHNQGRTIYCKDKNGNIHAALFVVWDKQCAYDLISTIDPDFRNSGAASLLVYEMIKYLSDKVASFDFEGSMIEGVETSFRKFGAVQTPMMRIVKFNTRKMKFIKILNDCKNLVFNISDYEY